MDIPSYFQYVGVNPTNVQKAAQQTMQYYQDNPDKDIEMIRTGIQNKDLGKSLGKEIGGTFGSNLGNLAGGTTADKYTGWFSNLGVRWLGQQTGQSMGGYFGQNAGEQAGSKFDDFLGQMQNNLPQGLPQGFPQGFPQLS